MSSIVQPPKYRRTSLFYPALIGTCLALVATAVAGLAVSWICRSSRLSRNSNGLLLVVASSMGAASATTLIIGLIVTYKQNYKRVDPSISHDFYPKMRSEKLNGNANEEPDSMIVVNLSDIATQNVQTKEFDPQIIQKLIDERTESFTNFITVLTKDDKVSAKITDDFKKHLLEDLILFKNLDEEYLPYLVDSIMGCTFDCITKQISESTFNDLGWLVLQTAQWQACKTALSYGVDGFFDHQPILQQLKNQKVYGFMKNHDCLNPLASFILKLYNLKKEDQKVWLEKFQECRTFMDNHPDPKEKKKAGMIHFATLCADLAL